MIFPPKKNIPTIASFSIGVYASASLVASSLGFLEFGPPPPSRPPTPPSKVDVPRVASLFLHQALIVQQLIVMLGPNFRVSSSPVRSSQLSCRCRSLRLHRPSIYYLRGVPSQSHRRALGHRPISPSPHGSSGSPFRFPPNSLGSSGPAPAVFIGSCGFHSR